MGGRRQFVVTLLLQAGADPNEKYPGDRSPLDLALESSRVSPEVVRVLLENGAKLQTDAAGNDLGPRFSTDLTAARKVLLLIKFGYRGDEALVRASTGRPGEITAYCRSRKTAQAARALELTPLIAAAHNNADPQSVAGLIRAGAKVNEATGYGLTPLTAAILGRNSPAVVAVLLETGARVDEPFGLEEVTPLMLAAQSSDDPVIVRTLLAAGADPRRKDRLGRRPLMCAALNDKPEMVRALLEAGAPVNEFHEYGAALQFIEH